MLLWNPVLQRLGLKPVDTSTKRTQNDGPWASGRFGAFQWCEALSPTIEEEGGGTIFAMVSGA